MKICMFTNTYVPHVGGVAKSVEAFTEDLGTLGHNVLVVAPTFPEAEAAGEDEQGILRVPAIQNFNGTDFSVRIPIPFVVDQKIDAFQPDVIHSHHPFLLGDAALRAARYRDLPLVFTHHTLYEKYTHYVSSTSETMKRLAINLSTEYANLCTHVVAPSDSVARLIRKRGVTSPITEIPTGVDVDFFADGDGPAFRKADRIPEDALVIGHLGRLAPEKNLTFLSEAISGFLKGRMDAVFLVVGAGPSESEMKETFEGEGIADRLLLAGKQTGDSLRNAYAAMDLFVFSSRSETQGMVLTEAMASGTPVIALDASGAREVVRDRENGRLLPKDASPEDFADAVSGAVQDPDRLSRWSEGARKTAREFSRRRSAEKLENVYRSFTDGFAPTASTPPSEDPWTSIRRSLAAEWDLLSEKAAVVAGLWNNEDAETPDLD